jgi:hypothetical protein
MRDVSKYKITHSCTQLPLTITNNTPTVFQKCLVGIVGPFSRAGNSKISTVENDLSKILIAVSLIEQSPEKSGTVFADNVTLFYGTPQIILSHCGSQFLSETLKGV